MTNQSRGELVPGGLALVYGLKVHVEDNGKIVELQRRVSSMEMIKSPATGAIGLVDHAGWLVIGDIKYDQYAGEVGFGIFRDENLLPINPEADPLDITEQMECKA